MHVDFSICMYELSNVFPMFLYAAIIPLINEGVFVLIASLDKVMPATFFKTKEQLTETCSHSEYKHRKKGNKPEELTNKQK